MSCDRSSCCGTKLLAGKNVIKWTKSKSCQRVSIRGVFHTFVVTFGVWIHQLRICQLPSSLPTSLDKLWFSCDSAATVWFCCHNLAAFVERWTLFCSHGWGCVSSSLPRNSIFLFFAFSKTPLSSREVSKMPFFLSETTHFIKILAKWQISKVVGRVCTQVWEHWMTSTRLDLKFGV